MFGGKATLPVDWVFAMPSTEKRTMYNWTRNMLEERQKAYQSMREVQGGRVQGNAHMYKPLIQNIRAICLVWYSDSRTSPGYDSQIKIILGWALTCYQTDSSCSAGDQVSILTQRRKVGELGGV